MPTNADGPVSDRGLVAIDTSVAVAYLDAAHAAHRACVAAVEGRSAVLAGHAAFESLSVLTRLPGASQVSPDDAVTALTAAFPGPCWLTPEQQSELLHALGPAGVHGGSVYDALVGEAARVHGLTLLTRDRRAIATYEFLGVTYSLVG